MSRDRRDADHRPDRTELQAKACQRGVSADLLGPNDRALDTGEARNERMQVGRRSVAAGTMATGPWSQFDRALSVRQVAEILGTSTATVRRLLEGRHLEFQRVSSRRTVIRESALLAYLEAVTIESQ